MSVSTGEETFKLQRRNYLQANKFDTGPSKALIFRRDNPPEDPSTEISNEIGTTDQVIGEPSVEEMLTTPGKIPNEMYDLENTPPGPAATSGLETNAPGQTFLASEGITDTNESGVAEPSIFLIIGVIIGILLLFGCIIACAISRVKKNNYNQINRKDIECNAADRPLLSPCRRKDSSTSTCCRN